MVWASWGRAASGRPSSLTSDENRKQSLGENTFAGTILTWVPIQQWQIQLVAFDGGHVFRFADRHPSYACQVHRRAAWAAQAAQAARTMHTAIVKKRSSGKGSAKSLDRKKMGAVPKLAAKMRKVSAKSPDTEDRVDVGRLKAEMKPAQARRRSPR